MDDGGGGGRGGGPGNAALAGVRFWILMTPVFMPWLRYGRRLYAPSSILLLLRPSSTHKEMPKLIIDLPVVAHISSDNNPSCRNCINAFYD